MNTDFANNSDLLREIKNGNIKAKEEFIKNNLPLVKSIAKRFTGRGCELEDLIEIGTIGLIRATDGFDDNLGYSFSTYAFSLITGEIKRHLRDDGIIKISRSIKKNATCIEKARQNYIKEHGCSPKISQLAQVCNLTVEETVQAMDSTKPIHSLFEPISDGSDATICETIADQDEISRITDRIALRQEVSKLSEFEKQIILMRYYKNLTQSDTSKHLGVSQVTISRTEKKIIDKLRKEFL